MNMYFENCNKCLENNTAKKQMAIQIIKNKVAILNVRKVYE